MKYSSSSGHQLPLRPTKGGGGAQGVRPAVHHGALHHLPLCALRAGPARVPLREGVPEGGQGALQPESALGSHTTGEWFRYEF